MKKELADVLDTALEDIRKRYLDMKVSISIDHTSDLFSLKQGKKFVS